MCHQTHRTGRVLALTDDRALRRLLNQRSGYQDPVAVVYGLVWAPAPSAPAPSREIAEIVAEANTREEPVAVR